MRRGARRGLGWLLGLLVLLGVGGVSWWVGSRSRSPAQAAAEAAEPKPGWVTAAVERRVLASTVVLRGDVRSQVSVNVVQPVSVEGSGVVTRLPPAVGETVAEGKVLVEVSGRPVFVLAGAVPAFRSLKPGMEGNDVRQLQDALARLGLSPDRDGKFGDRTKEALAKLYVAGGYDPVPSAVTATQVDQANRTLRDQQLAVKQAESALDKAERDLKDKQKAYSKAVGKEPRAAAKIAVSEATQARDQAQLSLDNAKATLKESFTSLVDANVSSGPTVPQGEVVFVPSLPARVQEAITVLGPIAAAASGQQGDGGQGGGRSSSGLVRLSGGDLVVAMNVPAGSEGLVRAGMAVELLDENSNQKYPGKVVSIAENSTADQSGQVTFAATVRADGGLPQNLVGSNLRVTITAAATAGEALVVPLAAVSSSADGAQRVSVLAAGATDPVDVPVTAGISADGFVEVKPVTADALKPGDQVVVGR